MSSASTLTFFDPARVVAEQPEAWINLPPGIPCLIEEAQVTLNHGLLLAELLDVDGTEVLTILNESFRVSHEFPGSEDVPELLTAEDLPVLLSTFSQVLERLSEAVDEAGRPQGFRGTALNDSGHFSSAPDGSLIFKSHSIPLTEQRTRLRHLCAMLLYAMEHRLWLWQRSI